MKKILFIFITLMMSFSCEKEVLYNDYVQLSLTSYTFDSTNPQPLEVEVKTNNSAEWNVTVEEGDWLEYSTEPEKIILTAKSNESSEMRTAKIVVTSGNAKSQIELSQLAYGFTGRLVDFPILSLGSMSRNGLYAGYVNQELDDISGQFNYDCRIYNTESGEYVEYEVPTVISGSGIDIQDHYTSIQAISNDGSTIMFYHSGHANAMIRKNDQVLELKVPDGYSHPSPNNFSEDASVIVGSCKYDLDNMTMPIVWRNGEPEILEIPEFLPDGKPMGINGVILRGCSDDGSVIYGSEWRLFGLIYWRNGQMVDIGSKYAEDLGDGKVALIQQTATYTNISPNGKFIAAYFNASGGSSIGAIFYPVVVNTETGEATIYEEHVGYMGIHAMNDGSIFVQQQLAGTGAAVIDYKTGELKSVTDWSKERYGLTINDNRFIRYISADESVIFGEKVINSGSGVLTPGWFLRR